MSKTKGTKNTKRSLSKNAEGAKSKRARKDDVNNNVLNDLELNNFSQIEKDFENIRIELGFKASNITSMLKTKIISLEVKRQLTEVLNNNKEAILLLINDLKFKPSNISSILSRSCSNTHTLTHN